MAHPEVLEIDEPSELVSLTALPSRRFISRAPSLPGGLWEEGAHGTAIRRLLEEGSLRRGDWWLSVAHAGMVKIQIERAKRLEMRCSLVISARIPHDETRYARDQGVRAFLGSAHSFSRDGYVPKYRWYTMGELVILTRRLETLLAATVTLQREHPGSNFFLSEKPDPSNQ